jgi:quercetin dioxygenase-like cupin family protein
MKIVGPFNGLFGAPGRKRWNAVVLLSTGLVSGLLVGYGWASVSPPTEHKGLEVEELGYVPAESMAAQVGLDNHKLLLRKITIDPGGQIAKHSAESTPAVVYMLSGTWTEGRASGETEHSAGETFIEDKDTVHWFYNRGQKPATALVCDIKPAG